MVVMTSFPPPTEGLQHVQANTQAFVHDKCYGVGTLYVAEERLSWRDLSGQGFSLEYPSISLHAVCRDTTQFPHECIYCMTDSPLEDKENDSGSDDSDGGIGEVRFVPEDKTSLDSIYKALSACQALHPDPEQEEEDDDWNGGGDGMAYFRSAQDAELSEAGQATLARLEGAFGMQSLSESVGLETTTNGHKNGHGSPSTDVSMPEETEGQFEDVDG